MTTYHARLLMQRLQKQMIDLEKKPIQNILVSKNFTLSVNQLLSSVTEFHFCIYGLQAPYQSGFYHGLLELPQNYPFSAPKLKFFTESGRFETDKYICTTFTSYHQQQWSSSWTLRTILLATQSFFLGQEVGYGTIKESDQRKKLLAKQSLEKNLQNDVFVELFADKLIKNGVKNDKIEDSLKKMKEKQNNQSHNLKATTTTNPLQQKISNKSNSIKGKISQWPPTQSQINKSLLTDSIHNDEDFKDIGNSPSLKLPKAHQLNTFSLNQEPLQQIQQHIANCQIQPLNISSASGPSLPYPPQQIRNNRIIKFMYLLLILLIIGILLYKI